jgi:hypothetical protein
MDSLRRGFMKTVTCAVATLFGIAAFGGALAMAGPVVFAALTRSNAGSEKNWRTAISVAYSRRKLEALRDRK